MRKYWFLTVLLALVLLLAGCAQPQSEAGSQNKTIPPNEIVPFTIIITANGFVPSTIRVHEGDRVQLTFITEDPNKEPHPTKLIGYGLVGPLNAQTPSQTVEFTLDKRGTFGFFCVNNNCIIHSVLLDGKIIVQ